METAMSILTLFLLLFLFAAAALFLLAALYFLLLIPRFRSPDSSALTGYFYAHRGLHDLKKGIPENSMKAFRLAVEKGYGIELDVQLSADGVPVVFHDDTLTRVCGVDRRVCELTLSELKKLPLGKEGFPDTGERIPTFAEFLEMADGRVPLIVELKMEKWDARIPEAADRLLRDYKGPYCVESFHPGALVWYRKHRPDVFRGQLCTNFAKEHGKRSLSYFLLGKMLTNIAARPDFIAYDWRYRNDLSRRICCGLYHALPVAWTIRSQKELDECRGDFRLFIFEGFEPDAGKRAAGTV